MRIFPFLGDDGTINGLKAELSAYLAANEDVVINTEEPKVQWWHNHKDQLPHWESFSEESAADAAILSCSRKGILYYHALVDYLQASVITQYNKR